LWLFRLDMTAPPCTHPFLIGRASEQEQLAEASASGRPELVAIHGRRRIGKTYLVRSYFAKELCFEMTGVCDAPLAQQLKNFVNQMKQATGLKLASPADWTEAFQYPVTYLEPIMKDGGHKETPKMKCEQGGAPNAHSIPVCLRSPRRAGNLHPSAFFRSSRG